MKSIKTIDNEVFLALIAFMLLFGAIFMTSAKERDLMTNRNNIELPQIDRSVSTNRQVATFGLG